MEKTIVLLRPPLIFQKWENASTICPPLGLAYVAAAIRNAGFNLRCVDALGEAPFQRIILENPNFLAYGLSTPEIVERVGQCNILGISLMFSHDWPVAKSVIRALRQANPKVTIICGGEHVNAIPEFCLQDCPEIDICVLGEGEETIVDLLKTLHGDCRLEKVPGIVFRSNNSSCVRTPPRARIRKLEEIAWPAWDLFPLENS